MASKMILIFCDGRDGDLSQCTAQPTGGDVDAGRENTGIPDMVTPESLFDGGCQNKQTPTNIFRLLYSVKSLTTDGKKVQLKYEMTIPLQADLMGDTSELTPESQPRYTDMIVNHIHEVYFNLALNFEDGDEICIFGFSRAAYAARKLAELIDRIGLLARQDLEHFFPIWRQLRDGETLIIPKDTRHPRIKCIGLWDTVGWIDTTIKDIAIQDTSLPATVDIALHALSLQENRLKFIPTLWTTPKGGLAANQTLKQVWFPGAHSDVGGGYKYRELADLSLFWMVGEIKSFIDIDLDFLRSTGQRKPEPWGTSQPHNAHMERPNTIGLKTRLDSGQITATSSFHQSLAVSPQVLASPDNMITTSIIQKAFGSDFRPFYPPLNEFEVYCKTNWNVQPERAPEILTG